ncbi:hypothetical protein [Phenylobacterium sp.]|uniref:hypothetical protein n=1 Tax=Phenylobacterium sp. TaxID=1871053 RepID=UPI002BB7D9AE|nr:hypothetical protein [Phenylobacterium sp.]HLZ77059.1 hypothetical protein [Phenylobacterium sp.]
MFEPGDMVECVKAGPIQAPGPFKGQPSGLTQGAIYTVKEFHPVGTIPGLTVDGLEVREAAHPDPRMVFPAYRFRLLKSRDPEFMAELLRAPAPKETVGD